MIGVSGFLEIKAPWEIVDFGIKKEYGIGYVN